MADPDDPEFRLAAACCRWPPTPARDAAVRAAAVGVDWARFGRVVPRQRIAGLVDAALRSAGVAPPPDIASPIARAAQTIVRQNLLAVAETSRLVELIAGAGHAVLAVKGVALGALAYGSIGLKHSKDIDLLVLPAAALAVIALLEAEGYRLLLPAPALNAAQRRTLTRYGKDVTLVGARGQQVELHWRLFDSRALLPSVTATSPTQLVTLAGSHAIPTLAHPALYAYLVQHGAVDGWSRLKWLADLGALLAPLDEGALTGLHTAAVALGAGTASAQALLLLQDVFGRSLSPELAETLARSRHVHRLVAGASAMMVPPDGARETHDWRAGQMRALGMQILLGRGVAHRWQVMRGILYPPAALYRSTLPPRLYALYPFIRITAWALQHLPGGPRNFAPQPSPS